MKDVVKTIGNLIDKASNSIISSVDNEGFPNTKAMLPARLREGIKYILFYQYFINEGEAIFREPQSLCLLL